MANPGEYCENSTVCGNTQRFISPRVCTALAMRINPVGFRVGETYGCQGCGAEVISVVWDDSTSPDPPRVDPVTACYFPEAIGLDNL
jgi:hypothetical protein